MTTSGGDNKLKSLDAKLEDFFGSPIDQDEHHTIRLSADRFALFPPSGGGDVIVDFRRVDKKANEDYYGAGFNVADGKTFFKLYAHHFIQLDSLGAFRILQACANLIHDHAEKIDAGLISSFSGKKKEYLARFTFPPTRIAQTSYAMDCHWSPKQKISKTDAIPEGYFVRLRRIEKPTSRDALPVYLPASESGVGFRIGIATYSRLYRNMFCLPKGGRETFQDWLLYQKDNNEEAGKEIEFNVDISSDDDSDKDWFDNIIPKDEFEVRSKKYDDNQFQLLIQDRIEEHQQSCGKKKGDCSTCKIDASKISNWDKCHRGGHLCKIYGKNNGKFPIDWLRDLTWRKTGSESREDIAVGSSSGGGATLAAAPRITTWDRIKNRKRARDCGGAGGESSKKKDTTASPPPADGDTDGAPPDTSPYDDDVGTQQLLI